MPLNYADYPPNWKAIRAHILQRAGNCCEECGAANGSPIARKYHYSGGMKAAWPVVLSIAHLDHDKENFAVSDDRLKALCQRCHFRYDLGRHIENRKYGRYFRKHQLKLF